MLRSETIKRWAFALALVTVASVGASGCLLVPVPVPVVRRPVVVAPRPPVVVVPGPVYGYPRHWYW